jgi:hypothetical protein
MKIAAGASTSEIPQRQDIFQINISYMRQRDTKLIIHPVESWPPVHLAGGSQSFRIIGGSRPDGQSPEPAGAQADCHINRVCSMAGKVFNSSSGDFSQIFAACCFEFESAAGRFFILSTASLNALSHEHSASKPVIRFRDDTSHLEN